MFVPVPCQDLDFQHHMTLSFFFVFIELRRDVIVCFVVNGGIDDHHCLSVFHNENTYSRWQINRTKYM
jgi:tRNA pseudouridine-54 N-methylase